MSKTSAPVSFDKPLHWDDVIAYVKLPGGTGEAEKRMAVAPVAG